MMKITFGYHEHQWGVPVYVAWIAQYRMLVIAFLCVTINLHFKRKGK